MAIARANNTTTGLLRRALRAAQRGVMARSDEDDPLRTKLASLARQIDEFEAFEMHVSAGRIGVAEGPATSALKLIATELHQTITEAGLEAAADSDFAQAKYFATRAATIYSGTSQVHRNILAQAIGCP
jgi:alkylation response protein AidB-like acyl-CoA dehydrogenase